MQDNYFTKETLKSALEAKGITTNAEAQPIVEAMIKKGAIIQGINEPAPSLGQKLMGRAKTIASEVTAQPGGEILKSADTTSGTDTALAVGQSLARTAQAPIRVVGAVGGAIGDVIGAGLDATGISGAVGSVVAPVVQSEPVQKAVAAFQSLPKETQDVLGAILNSANIPTGGAVEGIVKSGVESGVKSGLELTAKAANAVADNSVVKGITDITKMAGQGASRIPARIATNVAEKQAQEAAIKALPTKTSQIAARDGVAMQDIKDLSSIPRTPQTNKLIQTVKDFASGNTKVDPMEVIGEQAVKRFKEIVAEKKVIGAKLGEASKTIGILTKPELQSGVLKKLQSVPGLEGISLTPKGLLNFKGTTLEGNISSTVADKKALQEAFNASTKWGDGEKAHMFRQTLFENLGGKKKSLANITDTQEKSFEAIRSGLSDVIETKSPQYKILSNEYRKIVEPIKELQKRIKTLDPNAADLTDANLGAGILARRITSAAPSNADIRNLLKKLDSVGSTKGSSFKDTVDMQNVYNILNKYYDIAPKTGYQNLTKQATSDSLTGTIKETLKDVAGQSNAVRQKALEDLLKELGIVLK